MKKCIILLLCVLMVLPGLSFGEGETKKLDVTNLTIRQGVIVDIEVKTENCELAGYYFGEIPDQPAADNYDWLPASGTFIRITKFPNNYWLWLRDTEGTMYGPWTVELPDMYNHYIAREGTEFPGESISLWLPEHAGVTVEEVNEQIMDAVAEAGLYTREAVVLSVTTQLSILQGYGIRIPFFFYGYWAVRDYGWYMNPDWGYEYDEHRGTEAKQMHGKIPAEHERGTHCNGFVHYAFHMAGLNVNNTGDMGETGEIGGVGGFKKNRIKDYHQGIGGDIMQSCTKHEMLIIDRYDEDKDGLSDGYIVAESNDTEGGQVYALKPYDSYTRFCKLYNMDGVFYNTATQQRMLKYWDNYHIPEDSWPDYLKKVVYEKTQYTLTFCDSEGVRTGLVPYGTEIMADMIPEIRGFDADGSVWDTDVTGLVPERNFVINAVPAAKAD